MKKLAFIKRSNGSHWVGDGFPVQSMFSYRDIHEEMSPFVLMDYVEPISFEPTDKRLGVGPHPHRGFETVTIVYKGEVSHRDSTGKGGTIGPGDVQWMTADAGILHSEHHGADYARHGGPFEMIQLWVNLAIKDKWAPPAYQGITDAEIPRVALPEDAGTVRLIAGEYTNNDMHTRGAAHTFSVMNLWDLRLNAGKAVSIDLPAGHTTALFVLHGEIRIGESEVVRAAEMAVMERAGTLLSFTVTEDTVLLLLSGEPLNEPIVGHGPFVMSTQKEIEQAIKDYKSGAFGYLTD